MRTVGWLSAAVEKIWDFLVGMTVLRAMSLVKTPPVVSIPACARIVSCGQSNDERMGRTEGEGAHVDEDDVSESLLSGKDTSLNGSSVGDGLVGVDSLRGLLAVKVLLEELLDLGDTSGSADEAASAKERGQLSRLRDNPGEKETHTMSSTCSFLKLASLRTCSTGFIVLRKRSRLSSSNLARVREIGRASCRERVS